MSASQYSRQLENKLHQQLLAEGKAADYRSKESKHRSEAIKARLAASKTKSPSTQAARLRDAARRDADAERAGKEAGRWQTKALGYAKDTAALRTKLSKAEAHEEDIAARAASRQAKAAEQRAAATHASLDRKISGMAAEVQRAVRAVREPRQEKLRILLLGASSDGGLRIGREQAQIRRAVESSLHRDLIELDARSAATTADLLDGLSKFRPHVVHFSGHSDEQLIEFEDDVDDWHQGIVVTAAAFAHAVRAVDDPPLLIMLNSCNSEPQIDALVDDIAPFAIGMPDEIADSDAISYAARFYSSLADGQSVRGAHLLGRSALELAGLEETQLPRLAISPGVDASTTRLVEVLGPRTSESS